MADSGAGRPSAERCGVGFFKGIPQPVRWRMG